MKHYIKTLAMLLMVSLGFAACNDNDDFDNYKVTYPTSIPQGYYHSTFTFEGDYEYGVLLTKDNDNNTVLQLISEGKSESSDSAVVRTLLATTSIEYVDSLGTLIATDTVGNNFYQEPMSVYMAYKKNCKDIVLAVTHGEKKFSTTVLPSTEQPSVASRWTNADLVLDLKNVAEEGNALPGYLTMNASAEDAETEKLTYSYDGKNGSFTSESGVKGSFSYNEKYQLIVTINNVTYTCNRSFSVPEPEMFNQIAIGTYAHGVGVIEGGAVFNDQYEAGLYQSDKNPNNYIIAPWLNNAEGLMVMVDPETKKITIPQQFTGIEDPNYGALFGIDVMSYTGGQVPSNSYFDGNVFHLDLAYVVSAGYFGMVNELFTITEKFEGNKKVPSVKSNNIPSKLMKINSTIVKKF